MLTTTGEFCFLREAQVTAEMYRIVQDLRWGYPLAECSVDENSEQCGGLCFLKTIGQEYAIIQALI